MHDTEAAPGFDAVMVIDSPLTPPTGVAATAGVSSFVTLSVNEVPVSDASKRSTAVGVAGAVESMESGSAGPADDWLPAGSVTFDVIDQSPSVMVGRSQLLTVGDATYSHDTADPSAFAPEIVTLLPSGTVPPDIDGVVSLVLLSVFDAPESDEGRRSGAVGAVGAVVSMLIVRPPAGPAELPAGSVTDEVIAQSP